MNPVDLTDPAAVIEAYLAPLSAMLVDIDDSLDQRTALHNHVAMFHTSPRTPVERPPDYRDRMLAYLVSRATHVLMPDETSLSPLLPDEDRCILSSIPTKTADGSLTSYLHPMLIAIDPVPGDARRYYVVVMVEGITDDSRPFTIGINNFLQQQEEDATAPLYRIMFRGKRVTSSVHEPCFLRYFNKLLPHVANAENYQREWVRVVCGAEADNVLRREVRASIVWDQWSVAFRPAIVGRLKLSWEYAADYLRDINTGDYVGIWARMVDASLRIVPLCTELPYVLK